MPALAPLSLGLALIAAAYVQPEDRATKVRRDRQELLGDETWIYNDFETALDEAASTGKPLFIVFRCIPCEACSEFDKQLLEADSAVRDLFNRFVCVRIVQANGLDLSLFQFDYDQSFHAMFMNADKTIYGRFGTRSARPEEEDMTMPGLRQAMLGALELHEEYPANKQQLAGKQPRPVEATVPEELPSLKGEYGSELDYEGQVVQSCIHCHQIRDAERIAFRTSDESMPDRVLYPYPLPDVLGLAMDPKEQATIAAVADGSLAADEGFRPGDRIETLAGQPILSTADIQWVLHNAPTRGDLNAQIVRGNDTIEIGLLLDHGWRRNSDISFRVTTWDLRRMATGGLVLEDLPDDQRRRRKLPLDGLALLVKHVGQYGDHAGGKNAGVQEEDVIVAAGDETTRMSESQFIESALRSKRPGDKLAIAVLRGKERLELELPMQ